MIYIFGYGIQGRSHALNLRDSGHDVQIINRNDSYFNDAISDGFKVSNTFDSKQLKNGDIIYVLLPEEVHEQTLNDFFGVVEAKITIVFAHGYTLAHTNFDFPSQADLLMIAPRFPGAQVRDYYCDGSGVLAYISVFTDKSGKAHDTLNMLCVDLVKRWNISACGGTRNPSGLGYRKYYGAKLFCICTNVVRKTC